MSFRLGSFINSIANKIPTKRSKAAKPAGGGKLRKLFRKKAPSDEAAAPPSPPAEGDK
jgi:hypothetical protein